jgi:hypothetical protein
MTIAACPKCHDEVTVPPTAPRSALVRCPWCREQFALSDVLDRLPPMLEIVGGAAAAAATAREGFGSFATTADEDFKFAEAEQPALGSPSLKFNNGNALAATAASPAVSPRPRPKTAAPLRPRRKEKNALAEVVKVVIGGLVGLMLAQLILWWLPEPYQRDPAELGPVVGKYVPWIVPAEFRSTAGSAGDVGGSLETAPGGDGLAGRSSPLGLPRNTAGGEKPSLSSANAKATSDASRESNAEPPALTLGPRLDAEEAMNVPEEGPTALPGDPLSIPELEVGLAPGGDLNLDPLAPAGPPSGGAPPKELAFEEPHPPAPTDNAKTSDSDAAASPQTPPAKSETPAADDVFLGVKDAPLYVKDQVNESLSQAQAASEAFRMAEPAARAEAETRYYDALTDLAEKLTYADFNDPSIAELAEQARQMLTQGERSQIVAQAAMLTTHGPARLSAKQEDRPNQGIALFGRVQTVEKHGDLYELRLELPRGAGVIPVFTKTEPQAQAGAPVIVLGTLVEEPAKRLAGYQGRLPLVVWMGQTIALGQ